MEGLRSRAIGNGGPGLNYHLAELGEGGIALPRDPNWSVRLELSPRRVR